MIQDLTVQDRHAQHLQAFVLPQSGQERAAYVLCSEVKIAADPWTGQPRRKFLTHEVVPVPESDILSSSPHHITWGTQSFVNVLKSAQEKRLIVALVHSHPGGFATFSDQDDTNEADLIELAQHRNGVDTSLLSLVMLPDRHFIGRVWINRATAVPLDLIRVVGDHIRLYYAERGQGKALQILNRQALAFGEVLNQDLAHLRVGVVGVGGTGSAVALFLPRLGVRQIAIFDRDVVDVTSLNRMHGTTIADAEAQRPKVEVVARALQDLGLGVQVKPYPAWIGDPDCREALKSCDIVFGCTDDHAGRLFLNRFAYYYATPVIDLGLAIEVSREEVPELQALDGRVTVLQPGTACLLCRGVISPAIARDQLLRQRDPDEYDRRKAEAYVIGEGDPSPSVVLFTTDVASMGLQELLHRLQGFRGEAGAVAQRVRKFKLMEDRRQGVPENPRCPVCGITAHWGRGDVEPFLNLVE